MRFRATISNAPALTRLVASVERLAPRGILKLTPDKIYLICAGDANTQGGPQVWAQINVESIFTDYRIESNSDNEIYLEFVPPTLSKALKSSIGSESTDHVVRLAKKGKQAILSFNLKNLSRTGHEMEVVQEVYVRVLKHSDLEELAKEPMCPEPDVHILLPLPSDTMRGVVERMKLLGNVIQISANQQGVLRLKVTSDEATAETEWRDLKHPDVENKQGTQDTMQSTQEEPVDPSTFHAVKIETKNLLKLFGALQNGSHTIACICAGHCSIYYVYIGTNDAADAVNAGILTFFVPGISEGV